jgi:ribosomal protein L7/L12
MGIAQEDSMGMSLENGFYLFFAFVLVLYFANAIATERSTRRKHREMGFQAPTDPAFQQHLTRLVASGRKIEALKAYRLMTNAPLRKAKEAMDLLEKEIGT